MGRREATALVKAWMAEPTEKVETTDKGTLKITKIAKPPHPDLDFAIAVEDRLQLSFNQRTLVYEFYDHRDGVWVGEKGDKLIKQELVSDALREVFGDTESLGLPDRELRVEENGDVV